MEKLGETEDKEEDEEVEAVASNVLVFDFGNVAEPLCRCLSCWCGDDAVAVDVDVDISCDGAGDGVTDETDLAGLLGVTDALLRATITGCCNG